MNTLMKTSLAACATLALSACMTNDGGMEDMDDMDHSGHMMGAMLSGAAEVPGPGDSDGKGEFEYTINTDSSQLCYELEVSRIDAPTAAHIHEGAVGVEGGVVATLQTPVLGSEIETCMNIDPALARRLAASPQMFYVNIHNAAYPKGAVRGQLTMMMHDM